MSEIKKVSNNNKGAKTGAKLVDPQLLRWREALKKQGIVLGRASRYREKVNAERREDRKLDTEEKLTKKRWF